MTADPKKSESKAKAIAGQLLNRLMRDSALGAASGLCTEARCCISSLNHEIALFESLPPLDPRPDDLSPESIVVCSWEGHLDQPTNRAEPGDSLAHDVDRCERAFAMASSLASTVISSICARSLRWRLSRRSRLITIQI